MLDGSQSKLHETARVYLTAGIDRPAGAVPVAFSFSLTRSNIVELSHYATERDIIDLQKRSDLL